MATVSPGRSLRPRRPSASPLTDTASVEMRFLSSPPVSTTPASLSSSPRAMYSPVTSTSRIQCSIRGRSTLGALVRGGMRGEAVGILLLGRVVVPAAGPGREREQDAGGLARLDGVALAGLEQDDGALRARRDAARVRD